MKRILQFFIILVLCTITALPLSAQEPECACTNCPVPIYNNSVSYAHVNVEVNGENDLSTCPLTKVCFEVSHTWIGDLSASLISPNGTRYLIMADINNDTLGCGNQYNNINVCVNIGTDNPLTNNEEYECNGEPWACLNGEDWTVPCGVTDPRTPAIVAPNCDLNDFNTPGAPANGLWTLAVSDICPWDIGFIETFSLEFECGMACFSCDSDGGAIEIENVTACVGSEVLAITAAPTWETTQPDTLDYGYTFLLSQNDIILATIDNPDLTSAPAGEYQVCGFSYILIQANQLSNLIGQSLSGLQENAIFCGELSNNCGTIIVTAPNETTFVTIEKCENDCTTYNGVEYCETGIFQLTSSDGTDCGSITQLTINNFPTNEATELERFKCSNGCVSFENVEYCETGTFPLTYTGANGCDSLINLIITDFPTNEATELERFKCSNGCVSFENVEYCETGTFPLTYTGANGCDSLVNLIITDFPTNEATELERFKCSNGCVSFENVEYCETGTFPLTYTGANGCDSLVNLIITDFPTNEATELERFKCSNGCVSFENVEYCETGTFPLTYTGANGCDSLVNLIITDFPTNEATELERFKCSNGCVSFENVEYCETGTFPLTYTGANGCDSLVNLIITDFPITEATELERFKCSNGCVSFENVEYCETGTFPLTYTGANGCDSLVNLIITDFPITEATAVNLAICEDACTTYEGTEYCTIGNYNIILTGAAGCDSLINLTIENIDAAEVTMASLEICEGDCGEYEGTEYCTEGTYELTYEATNGCDSLVNLTVSYFQIGAATTASMSICETSCGIYEGEEYCLSGVFEVILINQYGCDSLVNLTVSYFDTNEPTQVNFALCAGECTTYEGEEYCEAGNYEVNLTGENDCDSLVNVNVSFIPTEIIIATPATINCTTANVTLDASSTTADTFTWTKTTGETIGNTATISVSEATCYTLTITNNGCTDSAEVCVLDESGNLSETQISGDALVCIGSEVSYTATSDENATSFTWTIPTNATIISGENTAEITLTWQDNNGGEICVTANNDCGTGENACLNVISNQLELVEVIENCDLATETYNVTIEVASNSNNLQINDSTGGAWNENIFTSGAIAGGTPFAFEITDGLCAPLSVSGLNDCVCITFAGDLNGQGLEVCQMETAILDYPENVVLDDNDALFFLIHDGTADQIGPNIFDIKTEPEFDLTGEMEMDVTYFSAAVAGNELTNTIDWDDTCLSVTVGVPVKFISGPSVVFTGETTICESDEVIMHLSFTGNAPFSAVINGEFLENLPTEHDYTVTVENTTTFEVESINDANGCTAFPSQSVTITVIESPSITAQLEATVCNTNGDDDIHVLNLYELLSDNTIPGTWQDTDDSNAVGSFATLDFLNVAPGFYTFTFTSTNAILPCENVSVSVEIAVENCSCPEGSFSGSTLCNESAILNLTSLQNETIAGTWSILNTPTGQNPATINGTTFNATGADAGDYFVQFVVENTPEGCPDTWTAIISVADYASAGESMATLEFCAGTEEIINLTEQLVGADAGGLWTETSPIPSQNNAFDAQNATLTTNLFNPGSYTFTYTQSLETPCSSESATVMVLIYDIPLADAGEEQNLTCEQSSAILGGTNTSQGEDLTYTWTVVDGFVSNEMNPEITLAGTYTLTVTNELGCTSSDEVTIASIESAPVADITVTSVGCYGDEDGVIEINNVSGGVEPYLYSLDGENFTDAPDFENLSAAAYTLVVEDANGCQSTVNFDITQPQELNVVLVASIDNLEPPTVTLGDSFDMEAFVNAPLDSIHSVTWSPSEYLNCDTCLNVIATPIETTTFTVTIQANACDPVTTSITVYVREKENVYVPNIFSPDDDGNNDTFYIFGDESVSRVNVFAIYDRWGERLFIREKFAPNDPFFGWDGTHKGQDVNSAVFVWYAEIELINGNVVVYKGDVTIAR